MCLLIHLCSVDINSILMNRHLSFTQLDFVFIMDCIFVNVDSCNKLFPFQVDLCWHWNGEDCFDASLIHNIYTVVPKEMNASCCFVIFELPLGFLPPWVSVSSIVLHLGTMYLDGEKFTSFNSEYYISSSCDNSITEQCSGAICNNVTEQ